MNPVTDLLAWTPWVPLVSAQTDRVIPRYPGLYRIRRVDRTDVDYIGQTGMPPGRRLVQREVDNAARTIHHRLQALD